MDGKDVLGDTERSGRYVSAKWSDKAERTERES